MRITPFDPHICGILDFLKKLEEAGFVWDTNVRLFYSESTHDFIGYEDFIKHITTIQDADFESYGLELQRPIFTIVALCHQICAPPPAYQCLVLTDCVRDKLYDLMYYHTSDYDVHSDYE